MVSSFRVSILKRFVSDVKPEVVGCLGDVCPAMGGLVDEERLGQASLVMSFKHTIYLKKRGCVL